MGPAPCQKKKSKKGKKQNKKAAMCTTVGMGVRSGGKDMEENPDHVSKSESSHLEGFSSLGKKNRDIRKEKKQEKGGRKRGKEEQEGAT